MSTTTKDKVIKANKQPKQPKTVKLSTIIWVISIIISLVVGFYLGQTAREAYSASVKSEAKTLVNELKASEQ